MRTETIPTESMADVRSFLEGPPRRIVEFHIQCRIWGLRPCATKLMYYLQIYNKNTEQIEYYGQKATPAFWDDHWNNTEFKDQIILKKDRFFEYLLKKYINKNTKNVRILEAGCGNGKIGA